MDYINDKAGLHDVLNLYITQYYISIGSNNTYSFFMIIVLFIDFYMP